MDQAASYYTTKTAILDGLKQVLEIRKQERLVKGSQSDKTFQTTKKFTVVMETLCSSAQDDKVMQEAGLKLHISALNAFNMKKLNEHAHFVGGALLFAKTEAIGHSLSGAKNITPSASIFDRSLKGVSEAFRIAQENVHSYPFLRDSSGATEFDRQDGLHKLAQKETSFADDVTNVFGGPLLTRIQPYTLAVSSLLDVVLIEDARSKALVESYYCNFMRLAEKKVSNLLSDQPELKKVFQDTVKEIAPVAQETMVSSLSSATPITQPFALKGQGLKMITPVKFASISSQARYKTLAL